jgi:DnaJ-class molecular chaperone
MHISSELPDYYKILNLPFGSSEDVIRATYRNLAKLFHPDNIKTGNRNKFEEIHTAYRALSGTLREKYDLSYKKIYKSSYYKDIYKTIILSQDRILYPGSITELARNGLLRAGLRNKDRKKFTGINHDIDLIIKKEEINYRILVKLPLTARVLCPTCKGSDIYCESCGGIGKYKSTRFVQIILDPQTLVNKRIFELELSRLKPDKFTHFKKKKLRLRIAII